MPLDTIYSNVAGGSTDQLANMVLFFNSTDRISADVGTPIFLRNIQALEFHTRVPNYLFYMYSFSLDPESVQPTGHVNFSRIDQKNLVLNMNPSQANRYITIIRPQLQLPVAGERDSRSYI